MAPSKLPGQPIRIKANELNKAVRAGEMLDQLQGLGVAPGGVINSALPLLIRNGHTTDLPAYGLTRWAGEALTPAAIGGNVPALILKTAATATTHPIGVVSQFIQAANVGASIPAGIGRLLTFGVAWARCYGVFAAGDKLIPDSQFRGIKDSAGTSNITVLASGSGLSEKIVPVLIGMSSPRCSTKYQLKVLWAGSGSFPLPIRVREMDVDGERTGAWVSEDITINYDDTMSEIQTAIEGHSELAPGEVTVSGPTSLLQGQATITLPPGAEVGDGGSAVIDDSALTKRGPFAPEIQLWECCS